MGLPPSSGSAGTGPRTSVHNMSINTCYALEMGMLRIAITSINTRADDFGFIRKRMQELAKEKYITNPGSIEGTSEKDIVNRRILNHIDHIRRRLPGENPSS
jgi:hypothetical protein